jgi:hypothetical protein
MDAENTFERWVEFVFDHPVPVDQSESWYWNHDFVSGEFWDDEQDPALTLTYLTRLFDSPTFLKDRYSGAQIDQGLYYLIDSGLSSHMFVLRDTSLPWPDRRAGFDAMCSLYSDLMALVYGNELGHLVCQLDPERPHHACYMWWDVIPISARLEALDGSPEDPFQEQINDAVLHIFRETLKLESEACLESVLHGLGDWWWDIPDETEPIVRRFLATRHDISDELRRYAELAALGKVQ